MLQLFPAAVETGGRQIRQAARLTKNHRLETHGDYSYARHVTVNSIARAIILNEGALARRLIPRSAVASKHLQIDSDGRVPLADTEGFQREVE